MNSRGNSHFDRLGSEYQERVDQCLHSLGGRDSAYYNRKKAEKLVSLVRTYLGEPDELDFLDLGCGTGMSEKVLARGFRSATGLDKSAVMIREASAVTADCSFVQAEVHRLPFEDGSFDLVFSMTMIHHLDEAELDLMTREIKRVLRPEGLTVHFDHNPYNFLTRQVVKRCEFDCEFAKMRSLKSIKRAARAGGLSLLESGYMFFIPAALKVLDPIEAGLGRLPLGAQYYLAASARP